jgi:hypothetical protein
MDYTVIRKEMNVEGDRTGERRAYTVTFALASAERTVTATEACYDRATPRAVFEPACR